MKKTGLFVAALSALTLMGCAGRYYDDNYHHDAYHRDYRDYRADQDYRDNWRAEQNDRASQNDRYRDDRDRY